MMGRTEIVEILEAAGRESGKGEHIAEQDQT